LVYKLDSILKKKKPKIERGAREGVGEGHRSEKLRRKKQLGEERQVLGSEWEILGE